MPLHIVSANFDDAVHRDAIITILDSYASDPIGGATPLAAEVRARLVPELRKHPTTRILIAFAQDVPVGLAVCFLGFSTFQARPLLNIHDLAVLPESRGRGVGRALLVAVEDLARREGCCKLTLEVLESNRRAADLYRSVGFSDYTLSGPNRTWFLSKAVALDGSAMAGADKTR